MDLSVHVYVWVRINAVSVLHAPTTFKATVVVDIMLILTFHLHGDSLTRYPQYRSLAIIYTGALHAL